MTNENKSDIEIQREKDIQSKSNTRALLIALGFLFILIAIIVYEVASKK